MLRSVFLTAVVCATLVLLGTGSSVSPPDASTGLAQFTSQGHILGFRTGEWFLSNGKYSLNVDFVNSNAAPPSSQAPVSTTNLSAAPLANVTYENLWDGIDLTYQSTAHGIVESVYTLEPNADAKAIRLRYSAPIMLNADGTLTLSFATGQLRESAPRAWQEINGTRVDVPVNFALAAPPAAPLKSSSDNALAFALGEYDTTRTLYIDPTLTWNTFLGDELEDIATGIAVDGVGSVHVAGYSESTWGGGECAGCPIRPYTADVDGFAAKLDSSGVLLWNTFLGGSGEDQSFGIAVGGSGEVFVTGRSNAAWGAPVRPYSADFDGFVARLDSSGMLIWNTFLGGTGLDEGQGVTVDGSNRAHVGGRSGASWGGGECVGCPIRAYTAAEDAFAVKLDATGSMTWNTFLGGAGSDIGTGVALDGSGNVHVSGYSNATWGTPVRAYTADFDGFAVKLDSSGALLWNTFQGGGGTDFGFEIAVDGTGNSYVVGSSTATWGTPVRAYTSGSDAFAARLDSSGVLVWNTFLGGSGSDEGAGVAVDGLGNVFVSGDSDATWGTPWRAYSALFDAFAARLNPGGVLVWNGFLGGSGNDEGTGIALDPTGEVQVSGRSNATWGTPIRAFSADNDGFAVRISEATTAVNVANVRASTGKSGRVILKWETTTESQIAGFDVHRRAGKSGWTKVSEYIQAKNASGPPGNRYRFKDKNVSGGTKYRYRIQVQYLDGHNEWSEVVKVKTP